MQPPLRVDQIQPWHDLARRNAEAHEPVIARLIQAAFEQLINAIDRRAVTQAIRENHFGMLWRQLGLERLSVGLAPVTARLERLHDQTLTQTAALIKAVPVRPLPLPALAKARLSRLRTPAVIALGYDPNDPARFTDALTDAVQASAQQTLSEGLSAGADPDVIARDLINDVGLDAQATQALDSYRQMLETNPVMTQGRALRDPRFDPATGAATLSPSVADVMVDRYAQRYRRFRAQRIAATESLRAANLGRRAAWVAYADDTGRTVRRYWMTAGDELVCPVCRAIPVLNPDGIALDAQYDSPIGPLDGPPDPHPGCRCSERFAADPSAESDDSGRGGGVGLHVEFDYGQ